MDNAVSECEVLDEGGENVELVNDETSEVLKTSEV